MSSRLHSHAWTPATMHQVTGAWYLAGMSHVLTSVWPCMDASHHAYQVTGAWYWPGTSHILTSAWPSMDASHHASSHRRLVLAEFVAGGLIWIYPYKRCIYFVNNIFKNIGPIEILNSWSWILMMIVKGIDNSLGMRTWLTFPFPCFMFRNVYVPRMQMFIFWCYKIVTQVPVPGRGREQLLCELGS
jgi:hypothetical protein